MQSSASTPVVDESAVNLPVEKLLNLLASKTDEEKFVGKHGQFW